MRKLQIVKATLGSIWLFGIPKEPYSLVMAYPATLLCCARWIVVHTYTNAYFLALAFCWDILFGFWLMIGAMASGRNDLLRSLFEMKDCTYQPIPFEQLYLTTAQYETIDQASLYNYMGSFGLPWKHDNDVEIVQVGIGPSNFLPNSLGVFHIAFIGSHILIRESPQEMEPFERFQFLHEVGHSLGLEFAQKSMLSKGIKSVSAVLLLCLPMLQWSGKTAAFVVLAALAILQVSRTLKQMNRQFKFPNAIRADAYALALLTREEKNALIELLEEDVVPTQDDSMDEIEHLYRLAEYKKNLKTNDPAQSGVGLGRPNMQRQWFDQMLAGTNLTAWMLLLSTMLRPADSHSLFYAKCLVGLLGVAGFARWLKFYIGGLYVYCILHGYLKWRDDAFRWHRKE